MLSIWGVQGPLIPFYETKKKASYVYLYIYLYIYIYVYIYIYIWQRLNKSVPRTVSLENGQTVRYLKRLNNLKFATRNKTVFVGFEN